MRQCSRHAAAVLMHERGEDAVIEAAMRADALLDKGDMDGRAVWLRVIAVIQELEATEPVGAVSGGQAREVGDPLLSRVKTPKASPSRARVFRAADSEGLLM